MSRKILLTIAALALIAVTGVASHAQDVRVKAHIPFAFTVRTATLPAGEYSLTARSQKVWEVQSGKSNLAIFILVRPEGTNEEVDSAKLVFNRYGDSYFLSEIRCLGETTEVLPTKAERALEREMARNGFKPESVYLLASAR